MILYLFILSINFELFLFKENNYIKKKNNIEIIIVNNEENLINLSVLT
jgi:hypothetical protein